MSDNILSEKWNELLELEESIFPKIHKIFGKTPRGTGSTAHGLIHESSDVDGAIGYNTPEEKEILENLATTTGWTLRKGIRNKNGNTQATMWIHPDFPDFDLQIRPQYEIDHIVEGCRGKYDPEEHRLYLEFRTQYPSGPELYNFKMEMYERRVSNLPWPRV